MLPTISVLCPSRARPDLLQRMVTSARAKGIGRYQILVYVDEDDPALPLYDRISVDLLLKGPPTRLGKVWNELASRSDGELLMMANDDLVFVTEAWDGKIIQFVENNLPRDRIFVTWTDDGSPDSGTRCAFPIVSREWLKVLGRFTPECFHFLWHDTWIKDVGRRLNRLFYIDHILIEHRHFTFGKADYDETYRRHRVGTEAKRNRREDKQLFDRTSDLRKKEAARLREYIKNFNREETDQ